MTKSCMHCFVEGRVQGVWFRESTRRKAQELNISGWVKNLEDGRVEVLGCGSESALEDFLTWLHQGPSTAEVFQVESRKVAWQEYSLFEIRR